MKFRSGYRYSTRCRKMRSFVRLFHDLFFSIFKSKKIQFTKPSM